MTPRLIVAISVISAMPVYAQAQEPNPLVTAARIVADTISSDPAKIETYCAIGKLDVLRVSCEKCGRDGHYILVRLIRKRGRDGKLIDWIDELTAECSKRIADNMNDQCGVRMCRRC